MPTVDLNAVYVRSLAPVERRSARRRVPWTCKVNRLAHDAVFDAAAPFFPVAHGFYAADQQVATLAA